MIELYLYWRTPAARVAAAQQALAAWQQALVAREPGLHARWLRRADAANAGEEVTLMEIYTRDGGIEAPLRRAIEAEGSRALADYIAGTRHVEAFVSG